MPTVKQKKAFKEVLNGSTISGAMVKSGYSKTTASTTGKLTRTKGWEELMAQELPDGLLAQRHRELLNARQIEYVRNGKDTHVELIDQPETQAVSKGLDMAYKLKGKYAPEKSLNVNVEVQANPQIKELADKLNALYRSGGSSSDGTPPSVVGDKAPDKE